MSNWQQVLQRMPHNDMLDVLRLRYAQLLAIVILLVGTAALINSRFSANNDPQLIAELAPLAIIWAAVVLLLTLRRQLRAAVALLMPLPPLLILIMPTNDGVILALGFITILTTGALATRPLPYVLANVIVFGKLLSDAWRVQAGLIDGLAMTEFVRIGVLLAVLSLSVYVFTRTTQRALLASRRSANLLRATAEVGQITASILDVNALLNRAVELVRDRFGFYHVQVFLVDQGGHYADLVASTGDAGRSLLEQGHRLAVGSNSVIGQVTRLGEPVVAGEKDAVHRHNESLPETRAELAVPIHDGETTIGALDVQSTRPNVFGPEDIQALQTMANLLGAALRNARLFEAQERSMAEKQRLFMEAEGNLREIQRLNQQLTRSGWADYLKQQQRLHGITLQGGEIVPDQGWSEALVQASQTRREVTVASNGKPGVVAVPVVLRGEVIGAIEVEPSDNAHTDDTIEMLKAIAQRLAIGVDNARLFEEAQTATAQEQQINTIVAHMQSATTVDELLRIALTDLSETLGARHGAIRLGTLEDETDGGPTA